MFRIDIISPPKVSIVTVVLNAVKTIDQTINSIINQSYQNIEYIIIDGGSTDGTIDIINKYREFIDVFITEPDNGISDAFNKGILISSGELIGLINADDWYETTAIKNIVNQYVKYPYYDIFYGNCNIMGDNGEPNIFKPKNAHVRLINGMYIAHPSIFVKKDAYLKYGLFDCSYSIAMDFEWLLRAQVCGAIFSYLNNLIANHRSGGISQINFIEGKLECAKAIEFYFGT